MLKRCWSSTPNNVSPPSFLRSVPPRTPDAPVVLQTTRAVRWLLVALRPKAEMSIKEERGGSRIRIQGHKPRHINLEQTSGSKEGGGVRQPVGVVQNDDAAVIQVVPGGLAALQSGQSTRRPIDNDHIERTWNPSDRRNEELKIRLKITVATAATCCETV